MNARDELAEVIYKARWVDGIKDVTIAADAGIADAILAAGYSKTRTITTVEELDALGLMATVLDANGTAWVNDGETEDPWASVAESSIGGPVWTSSPHIPIPATVLHEGGAK